MTNLIIHHSVADVFGQASKRIHVIGAVQEPCDLASLFQWGEVSENFIQFPNNHVRQTDPLLRKERGYRLRSFLLASSLTSPSGTGALSDCASPSTRGTNDFIVLWHAIVC